MELVSIVDRFGEGTTLLIGGAVIGALFGAFAQQSKFCLRAAAVEFARGSIGPKTATWLLVFTAAVLGTQLLSFGGYLATNEARQIASPQSLSGALLGGLMFGSGMVLARGCSSRLLVLSATGNLRALLSGLVFAVFAQASLKGSLSPVRNEIATYATTSMIEGNDLLSTIGANSTYAMMISVICALAAIGFATYRNLGVKTAVSSILVGAAIPLAWWFTSEMGKIAFEPVKMEAITFTGPSADTLMFFLNPPGAAIDFSIGLVPGVFIGSFLAALLTGQLQLQGFEGGHSMKRYLAGGALMGFGGMLAGGCAVGAGVTGASVFAITAWVTLFAIWLSAGITDWFVDRRQSSFSPAFGQPAE
ncbi:MAG: YeeE/YedE family protein [Salaquimonas sp.]